MGYIGVISSNPLILTFDPNFLGHPSNQSTLSTFAQAESGFLLIGLIICSLGFLLVLARLCIFRSPIAPYSKQNWVGSREWDAFANCGKRR